MTINGSGVRDIARVLHVSPTTVIEELKKLALLKPVNQKLLQRLKPERVEVDIIRVDESEEAGVEESELDARRGAMLAKEQSQEVMACNRPPKWRSFSLCVWVTVQGVQRRDKTPLSNQTIKYLSFV